MDEKSRTGFRNFYHFLVRVSFVVLLLSVAFLLFTLVGMVNRLENIAPAEMRFILEIIKNRFFR